MKFWGFSVIFSVFQSSKVIWGLISSGIVGLITGICLPLASAHTSLVDTYELILKDLSPAHSRQIFIALCQDEGIFLDPNIPYVEANLFSFYSSLNRASLTEIVSETESEIRTESESMTEIEPQSAIRTELESVVRAETESITRTESEAESVTKSDLEFTTRTNKVDFQKRIKFVDDRFTNLNLYWIKVGYFLKYALEEIKFDLSQCLSIVQQSLYYSRNLILQGPVAANKDWYRLKYEQSEIAKRVSTVISFNQEKIRLYMINMTVIDLYQGLSQAALQHMEKFTLKYKNFFQEYDKFYSEYGNFLAIEKLLDEETTPQDLETRTPYE